MVPAPQVQVREDCPPPHLVEDVLNTREGVSIQRSLLIKGPIVPTLPKIGVISLIFLSYYHRSGCILGLRGPSDEPQLFQLGTLGLHKIKLHMTQFVRGTEDRLV